MEMTSTIRRMRRLIPKELLGWVAYHIPYHRVTYSQFAEDVLLARLLQKSDGFYVDIGAFHPKFGSNTYRLWRQGWRGINIDVDDYKINLFRRYRPRDINLTLGVSSTDGEREYYFQHGESYGSMTSFESVFAKSRANKMNREVGARTVEVRKLDSIVEEHLPRTQDGQLVSIDLLSIDVEGHEHEILRVFDFARYRPKCICVEIHADCLADLVANPTYQLLEQNAYDFVAWPAPSCIFVARGNANASEELGSESRAA